MHAFVERHAPHSGRLRSGPASTPLAPRLKSSTDYTTYGAARHSPRTFYSHHAAAISAAIVAADALTILQAGRPRHARVSSRSARGLVP